MRKITRLALAAAALAAAPLAAQSFSEGYTFLKGVRERDAAEGEKLEAAVKAVAKCLGDKVSDVRLSTRLTETASCLVSKAGAPGANLERIMKILDERSGEAKRLLEINPDHPIIQGLNARFEAAEAEALAADNAATFYLAGHETTANALTWTLFLLSEQPRLQDEAAAEAREALGAGAADPDLPDRLKLLRLILEESMRLYPPVPRFDRQALGPDRLGEAEVAAGDIVSIWPWLIHRHRKLWDDADAFDPERFAARGRERHRFQYLPFGGGPRVCVGARFATAEALTILAALAFGGSVLLGLWEPGAVGDRSPPGCCIATTCRRDRASTCRPPRYWQSHRRAEAIQRPRFE